MSYTTIDFTSRQVERFWASVDQSGGPRSCWLWKGQTKSDADDYGRFGANGERYASHRVAYMLSRGLKRLSHKNKVCHKCDTPPCCNPKHLVKATQQWNVADREAKGRTARGVYVPHASLDNAKVIAIRERYAAGERATVIAKDYRVTPTCINLIIWGKTWAHVGGPITRYRRPRMTERRAAKIRALRAKGASIGQLCRATGHGPDVIKRVCDESTSDRV